MECKIIPEKCIACGLCQVYAPDVFDYTEEGIVLFKNKPEALSITVDSQNAETVTTAYRKCPVHAIELAKSL
ncbi:ferredoxin [Candidatus Enterococcus clewellii]|uniref:Ferredoxin n=1 Tax=Candidatus Enterococcus clewellii TaxID=1834193 RepID=A0A242KBJ3_9ENTE|nr:ferredoxin [Enterococcus sp. 9E7_DIV0242]OTP18522.1 hypothetical protein A5888_000336 [Enterococcus sp. 9E7_DIV0242]